MSAAGEAARPLIRVTEPDGAPQWLRRIWHGSEGEGDGPGWGTGSLCNWRFWEIPLSGG